jgi:hypothetical protein
MFYFRLNRLFIYDNKEGKKFLGLFGPDTAELRLISFIATEHAQLPDMSEFLQTTDETKRKKILQGAVEQVVSSRVISEVDNIKDHGEVTFGKTGYVLYSSDRIPESFDWQFIAYESDKAVRDTAQAVQDIVSHAEFDSFIKDVATLAKNAANPALATAVAIGKYAVKVSTEVAKKNKDDLIGVLYTSLIREEHYPHGERKVDRCWDLTRNMQVDYSIFGFDAPKS